MPLYDFRCEDCHKEMELLLMSSKETPVCSHCGSTRITKQVSAHSAASGLSEKKAWPGPKDTACCGSAPGQGAGCAGPGSCCGRTR